MSFLGTCGIETSLFCLLGAECSFPFLKSTRVCKVLMSESIRKECKKEEEEEENQPANYYFDKSFPVFSHGAET